jgi:hypothetical protein
MAGPAAGVFGVAFLVMGVLANSPDFAPSRAPSASVPPVAMAFQTYTKLLYDSTHVPEVCWNGDTVSSHQENQCKDFWAALATRALLAAGPIAVAVIFLMVGLDQLKGFYRKSRKKVEKAQALFAGTVTDPPEAPNDAFGWFYCLRAVSLELKNKTQMKVYLPIDAPDPMPGQTFAVFDGGKAFGAKRHIGVLYAPHLAVVSGVRH